MRGTASTPRRARAAKPRATPSSSVPAPTGTTIASGARPSCRWSSSANVVVPCRNQGVHACEAYAADPAAETAAAVTSCRDPSIGTTRAPYARICASLVADALAGALTSQTIPARAQYAASDAPALPEESMTARSTPYSRRALATTRLPRSLNEPVGRAPSSLAVTVSPPSATSTSGVTGSPSETIASSSGSSSKSSGPSHEAQRQCHPGASTGAAQRTHDKVALIGRAFQPHTRLSTVWLAFVAGAADLSAAGGTRPDAPLDRMVPAHVGFAAQEP